MAWCSAKRAGVKRACPNKVMAHMWFMHDAHLDRAFLFLDILAEYILLSMTVMVTPCLWYVVGMKFVCPMASFLQPLLQAPLLANAQWLHQIGHGSVDARATSFKNFEIQCVR